MRKHLSKTVIFSPYSEGDYLGTPAPTYLTDRMSASSRVCPQERLVWRFDAHGGNPWGGVNQGEFGRVSGDLSLFGDSSPSDQNEHSVRWQPSVQNGHTARRSPGGQNVQSVRMRSRPQNEVLIFGSCDRQRSTPQNEALISAYHNFRKSRPHFEALIAS